LRKLLNTLYVSKPDCYLALDNEAVCVKQNDETVLRVPLLNLEGIVTLGYTGASPALMRECAARNIALTFLSSSGRFLASVCGESKGNVLLRKEQYRISDDEQKSLKYADKFIFGKIYNAKWILERASRDYALRLDVNALKEASAQLSQSLKHSLNCSDTDELRGVEGAAATVYFREFDNLILQNKETFCFEVRNRRPPTDPINAMLSFAYTLLTHDCRAALETVGLDAYVGFLHRDRPGRASLALDLLEEFRGVIADRFVLTLINRKEISGEDFEYSPSGAVIMKDKARRAFIGSWQARKTEELTHPFIKEKISWGLVPYTQALLLARTIRGDLDAYPPFLWK
jgi:CRISPR-associated protein Cas1